MPEQYQETIEYYFKCRIAFTGEPTSKDYEFATLEDLLFQLAFWLTTKQIEAIRILKKRKGDYTWTTGERISMLEFNMVNYLTVLGGCFGLATLLVCIASKEFRCLLMNKRMDQ